MSSIINMTQHMKSCSNHCPCEAKAGSHIQPPLCFAFILTFGFLHLYKLLGDVDPGFIWSIESSSLGFPVLYQPSTLFCATE